MAPLHIDRGMADILTGDADDVAIWESLGRADVLGVDVVAQALVDRVAQSAGLREVGVLHARDEPRLDVVGALGRLRAGERAVRARQRLEQPLNAPQLGLGEARAGAARIAQL